jgi:hypothetical protein
MRPEMTTSLFCAALSNCQYRAKTIRKKIGNAREVKTRALF